MTDRISGSAFKQMIAFGAACVAQQKQAINDLNVFPVPDGDTGTNMSLTIQTAVNELKKSEPATVGEAAKITAGALLRGARGNSGVILSLLFRGISKSAKGLVEMDGPALAAAMGEGVATAYGAVMKPAEGTVLTVSRLAAARAAQAAQENPSAEYVLEQAILAGQETLAQTIDMNPVLKKAGVVDAGGKGYLIILDGMLRALRGEELPQVEEDEKAQDKADFGALSLEDITFTYDTVFIVRKKEGVSIEPFRAYLDGIGDSLVIGEDDEAFKVHVHTDIPGQALTEAAKYGTLELAKIENMRTQAEELAAGKQAQSTDDLDAVEEELEAMEGGVAAPEKRYGFLAVCAGDGLAATFRDLGVDRIVSGGQTMNPSTQAILQEVNRTPSQVVFVLPNNKNIIMAAEQTVPLATDREVIVIPTRTIPQGLSAMLAFDPDSDAETNQEAMLEAAGNVDTGLVTFAARDSEYGGHTIRHGDILGLKNGKLEYIEKDPVSACVRVARSFANKHTSFITLIYGEGITQEQAEEAKRTLESKLHSDVEITLVNGGQPVYFFIISVE